MYQLTVRDHMMVAHSLPGAVFGPAQRLHGATYVVDVTFYRPTLDANGLVVDIGAAAQALHTVLAEFNLTNLNEHPDFVGRPTTTEFMAGVIFERMQVAIAAGELGEGSTGLVRMRVVLGESPVAWAGYEADL